MKNKQRQIDMCPVREVEMNDKDLIACGFCFNVWRQRPPFTVFSRNLRKLLKLFGYFRSIMKYADSNWTAISSPPGFSHLFRTFPHPSKKLMIGIRLTAVLIMALIVAFSQIPYILYIQWDCHPNLPVLDGGDIIKDILQYMYFCQYVILSQMSLLPSRAMVKFYLGQRFPYFASHILLDRGNGLT
ncbi:Non-specific phospholipase C4 [Frankliniella fusca]|uniref:Non-specific phospholipase C4 n=1 Tax=Frankliniella fusca TaxID=407009 RepID=A0AAE1HYU9_9NEOP|nr:Non-specific phospholipase C4 [Frankliniella fusca]